MTKIHSGIELTGFERGVIAKKYIDLLIIQEDKESWPWTDKDFLASQVILSRNIAYAPSEEVLDWLRMMIDCFVGKGIA